MHFTSGACSAYNLLLSLGRCACRRRARSSQGCRFLCCSWAKFAILRSISRSTRPSTVRWRLSTRRKRFELLGVRTATGAKAQCLALLGKGLAQRNAGALGQPDQRSACHLQQPAIRREGHGLVLHRGVDDHALELGRLDRVHQHSGGNGRRQQLLDTGFAQGLPKMHLVSWGAWQARLEVLLAAEVLEVDVLRAALAHRLIGLVGLVGRVLQIQQAGHQPNRQTWPTSGTHTAPATAKVGPNRSTPATACPSRGQRAKFGANVASVCAHGMRVATTASGWRRSIIASKRLRKKNLACSRRWRVSFLPGFDSTK